MDYKVCAIIVTFNRLELLKGAIKSLQAQTCKPDVLIVNNGSTDGTSEYLNLLSGVTVINQDNVGGAGGFYTGIEYSCKNGYDFTWVMDDDIIASENCLEELLKQYEYLTTNEQENVGFLCSNVTNIDGYMVNNPVIDDSRLNPTYHPSWNKYLSKGIVGVKTATFVSVLIPCAVSIELGLPIKEFFIWGDDTEYTLRISQKYNCFLIGKSIIKHLRVGDKPLGLLTMEDKRRIKMYKNSIRNNIFLLKRGYYDKKYIIISILWHIITFMRLLLKLQIYKLYILVTGVWSGFFFNPKIKYPKIDSKIYNNKYVS